MLSDSEAAEALESARSILRRALEKEEVSREAAFYYSEYSEKGVAALAIALDFPEDVVKRFLLDHLTRSLLAGDRVNRTPWGKLLEDVRKASLPTGETVSIRSEVEAARRAFDAEIESRIRYLQEMRRVLEKATAKDDLGGGPAAQVVESLCRLEDMVSEYVKKR